MNIDEFDKMIENPESDQDISLVEEIKYVKIKTNIICPNCNEQQTINMNSGPYECGSMCVKCDDEWITYEPINVYDYIIQFENEINDGTWWGLSTLYRVMFENQYPGLIFTGIKDDLNYSKGWNRAHDWYWKIYIVCGDNEIRNKIFTELSNCKDIINELNKI